MHVKTLDKTIKRDRLHDKKINNEPNKIFKTKKNNMRTNVNIDKNDLKKSLGRTNMLKKKTWRNVIYM